MLWLGAAQELQESHPWKLSCGLCLKDLTGLQRCFFSKIMSLSLTSPIFTACESRGKIQEGMLPQTLPLIKAVCSYLSLALMFGLQDDLVDWSGQARLAIPP